jgi:hypothetical protein
MSDISKSNRDATLGMVGSGAAAGAAIGSVVPGVGTLYGCTDSSLYQRMAHELVDPWMEEASPKRSKSVLIRRLRDYDRWFGHGNGDK